jgi:hypothetical protein
MVRVGINWAFNSIRFLGLFMLGIILASEAAIATCPVPDGARIVPVTPRSNTLIYEEANIASQLAIDLSFTNQNRLWVYEDGNSQFYRTCYQPSNGSPPTPGFVRKDQVVENDPTSSPGGNTCAGRDAGMTQSQRERYLADVTRLPVVSLRSTIRLMDPPRGYCSDTVAFGAGTRFYIRGYTEFHGQRMARIAVKSPTKGWIEGWFLAADIENARTEGTYCYDGSCSSSETRNPYGPLGDIANHIMGPDQTGEGCRVLEEGPLDTSGLNALRACVDDLRRRIWSGTRGNRERLLCNMRFRLSPAEQEFAGLIFTSVGEGGVFVDSDSDTRNPKFQELAFIQQVIMNRTDQIRSDMGIQFNGLDASLADRQFSCYNSLLFGRCMRNVLNPNQNGSTWNDRFDAAVRAFLAVRQGQVQPQPEVRRVDMYYNPHGMTGPATPLRRNRLIRNGTLDPRLHPAHERVPDWDWNELSSVRNINMNGVPVDRDPPHLHTFFSRDRPHDLFYGSSSYIRRKRNGEGCR